MLTHGKLPQKALVEEKKKKKKKKKSGNEMAYHVVALTIWAKP